MPPPHPPDHTLLHSHTHAYAHNTSSSDTDSRQPNQLQVQPSAGHHSSGTSRGPLHDPTARPYMHDDHDGSRVRHRSSRDFPTFSPAAPTAVDVPLQSLPRSGPIQPPSLSASITTGHQPDPSPAPAPGLTTSKARTPATAATASPYEAPTEPPSTEPHPSLAPIHSSEHVPGATSAHNPTSSPQHSSLRVGDGKTLDPSEGTAGAFVDNMTSKKTPFLRQTSDSRDAPYGSVSLTPSRNASPASADQDLDNHVLRRVSDGSRSKRSNMSKQVSRLSEDLDGAMLVSGMDGRFGVAEAPLGSGMLDSDKHDDSEDGPLLEARSPGSDVDDEENSPHEAVRASVPPTDDTTLSINTPRMWTLSVLFSILGSSTNLFFSLRYPSVAITPVIALLLVHPLGLMWDYFLKRPYDPDEQFIEGIRTPSLNETDNPTTRTRNPKLSSWRAWLAQGHWNEKEHTCVYVSSNVAFGFAFATDVIVEQTHFYNQEAPILYQLLLTISTQILGYGFAGLSRRILVRPSGMIWPGTLMSAAMFSTLHRQENKPANGWKISRWGFFFIVWSVGFAFYFLPGLLFPALSNFNVLTWFAPKNVVVANLFGVSSGLGLFPITFDWAQITYIGSPLLVPFWAAMNVIGGLAIVMWIIAPILYYTNVVYSSYMPILSTAVFDNKGEMYNVTKILTPEFLFDKEAYRNYSRVFLPITYMLSYGVQFAALAALLTHTACWHGQEIWTTWKKAWAEAREEDRGAYQSVSDGSNEQGRSLPEANGPANPDGEGLLTKEDIHCRLMRRYPDVPASWYLITFLSMTAIGVFVVEYYPIHLPWYGLALALAIGAIFFIPNGIIMAITNQHSSIYLICQLICGAVFPGRPIANMVFVSYGYISSAQGIKFASDLKLGHYMKIPPRMMFTVQVVATLVSSVTQIGVLNWMFANVRGLCTPEAVSGFSCPIARVHFNGSILWGVVGVGEFFGPDALYRALVWAFPLGAFLPIPLWLYSRRKNHDSILRKVNLPVIFGAMSWIPPATGLNFSVWVVVCYIFNYRIKRRAGAWWAKYTMTLSAALDSGLAFGIVVVFFGFLYPGWMKGFSWWGTEVYKQGCDWQACPYRTLGEGERFGPETW